MNSTRREVCIVCDGKQTVSDPDAPGLDRVCGFCNGLGYKHVNAEAPCCDVVTHELEGPKVEA